MQTVYTFNTTIISVLSIGSPIVLYDAQCNSNYHNFVLNKFVHAGLDHLRLVARETNVSPHLCPN